MFSLKVNFFEFYGHIFDKYGEFIVNVLKIIAPISA